MDGKEESLLYVQMQLSSEFAVITFVMESHLTKQ